MVPSILAFIIGMGILPLLQKVIAWIKSPGVHQLPPFHYNMEDIVYWKGMTCMVLGRVHPIQEKELQNRKPTVSDRYEAWSYYLTPVYPHTYEVIPNFSRNLSEAIEFRAIPEHQISKCMSNMYSREYNIRVVNALSCHPLLETSVGTTSRVDTGISVRSARVRAYLASIGANQMDSIVRGTVQDPYIELAKFGSNLLSFRPKNNNARNMFQNILEGDTEIIPITRTQLMGDDLS